MFGFYERRYSNADPDGRTGPRFMSLQAAMPVIAIPFGHQGLCRLLTRRLRASLPEPSISIDRRRLRSGAARVKPYTMSPLARMIDKVSQGVVTR